jgi:integrase
MASLSTSSKNGEKRVRFKALDGQRKSIRLGRLSRKDAEIVRNYVGRLETAQQIGNPVDADTLNWLNRISDWLHIKLAQVGLIPHREKATLAAFLDSYIQSRTDTKPLTKKKYHTTKESLVEYFGADKPLRDITEGDADEWRLHLLEGRVENTVRKHIAVAKLFFRAAVKKRLIPGNPFSGLKATIQPNDSRFYFISREEAQRVIDACPDAEWRLIFALSRFGGLRCPSEHLALRWGDIDWEHSRMRVHSPKTEHHAGGESRLVPLFPELRPHLDAAWEQAESETEYVITHYRDSNVNLRSRLLDIIWSAGLKEWPKLFQNLRSTRQTELSETFPAHVVCKWMGNTKPIADRHYLQTTEGHFRKAVEPVRQQLDNPLESSGHGPAHAPHITGHNASCQETQNPVITENYGVVPTCTFYQVAEAGLEPARPITGTGF